VACLAVFPCTLVEWWPNLSMVAGEPPQADGPGRPQSTVSGLADLVSATVPLNAIPLGSKRAFRSSSRARTDSEAQSWLNKGGHLIEIPPTHQNEPPVRQTNWSQLYSTKLPCKFSELQIFLGIG
jgi:hypothetical protein